MVNTVIGYMADLIEDIALATTRVKPLETDPPANSPWYLKKKIRCDALAKCVAHALQMRQTMKLKDKVAIITGTTRGIGVALAKEYAKAGAKVIGTGRSVDLGQAVAQEIRDAGGDSIFVRCDVSSKADVDNVIAETLATDGTVDIVVNNAGVNHAADFFEISEEDWDWVMGVDLKGAFLMSQAGARVMVEQGKPGYIVNISSIMAKMALRNQVAYCAAKGGVNQLTTAMGLALIDKGIRVNCVAPAAGRHRVDAKSGHQQRESRKS